MKIGVNGRLHVAIAAWTLTFKQSVRVADEEKLGCCSLHLSKLFVGVPFLLVILRWDSRQDSVIDEFLRWTDQCRLNVLRRACSIA